MCFLENNPCDIAYIQSHIKGTPTSRFFYVWRSLFYVDYRNGMKVESILTDLGCNRRNAGSIVIQCQRICVDVFRASSA